jgi:hypothetical protein
MVLDPYKAGVKTGGQPQQLQRWMPRLSVSAPAKGGAQMAHEKE